MDFYKLIAKGYAGLYGEEQEIKHRIIKENLDIKKGDLLLDVGCGAGVSDFDCRVLGIDPSVELLKQNLDRQTILARAENIPFRDNTFDKVISVTSMHNFDDVRKSIMEMKRVGKSDFAFSILKNSSKFDMIEKAIKENFSVKKILDGKKDWIFICNT